MAFFNSNLRLPTSRRRLEGSKSLLLLKRTRPGIVHTTIPPLRLYLIDLLFRLD